jgi:hypothetical protein
LLNKCSHKERFLLPRCRKLVKTANLKAPKPFGKEEKAPKPVKNEGRGATRQNGIQSPQERSRKVSRSGRKRTEKEGKTVTKAQNSLIQWP